MQPSELWKLLLFNNRRWNSFGLKSCGGEVRYRLRSKLLCHRHAFGKGLAMCDKKPFYRLDLLVRFGSSQNELA